MVNELQEIRLRTGRKTIIKYSSCEKISDFTPNENNMIEILQRLCDNSIYSYQNQIINGFVTLVGGHRVGIAGSIAMKDGKVSNINYISALNFRIAKEVIGASDKIMKYIVKNGEVQNTLIVSKPGMGKTTILRDLVRNISENTLNTISVIDERGEIAAMYKGVPQNNIGSRCDVFDNVTKSIGMKMAIRAMSPDVIVSDEIGSKEDVEAINYALLSGAKGVFTAHGNSLSDVRVNENLNKLYEEKVFKNLIFLEKMGKVKNAYILENNMYKLIDENL
jgi:stage III sporulation protein AA